MENENTVPQDETQFEETFAVDESEDTEEVDTDEETEDGDESNQHQDEVAHLKAENAKLQRLLKKESKAEKKSEAKKDDSDYVTKQDLERIRLEAKGLTEKQVDFAMKYGGVSALNDPYLKKAIDEIAVEEKQISSTAESKKGGDINKKYTLNQVRNMPTAELEKLIREGKIKNI